MDIDDDIPHFIGHILEGLVTKNASVGNQEIDPAELIDSPLDHGFGIGFFCHVAIVGDSLAAGCKYFVDDLIGHIGICAASISRPTQVVNHNTGAFFGQEQGMSFPKTATSACNYNDFSV